LRKESASVSFCIDRKKLWYHRWVSLTHFLTLCLLLNCCRPGDALRKKAFNVAASAFSTDPATVPCIVTGDVSAAFVGLGSTAIAGFQQGSLWYSQNSQNSPFYSLSEPQ
jgi:hypothetical protein